MSYLLDDLARILASPIPRRQALRLIGATLTGGILAVLGIRPATAQQAKNNCGTTNCPQDQICCNTPPFKAFCVTQGRTCCGRTSCTADQTCCRTASTPFCATKGRVCCGNRVCDDHDICCGGVCCESGRCNNNRCSASS